MVVREPDTLLLGGSRGLSLERESFGDHLRVDDYVPKDAALSGDGLGCGGREHFLGRDGGVVMCM